MAKGSARKGMMMIGSTPGQRVKQLEIRTWKANGQQRSSPSKHQFLSADGVDNVFDMNYPPVEPMRLPRTKMQNDYIHEWLPQKEDFLRILLDLEAPPLPHTCKICGKDRGLQVPQLVQQWTGDFFEDSALHMPPWVDPHSHAGFDEDEWEDIDYIPLHLHPPVGSKTSGMNYYSKLRQGDLHCLSGADIRVIQIIQPRGTLHYFAQHVPSQESTSVPRIIWDDWRYTRTVVMDRNFKAEHMHEWRPDDQLPLHISQNLTAHQKSTCNNHKAISQASASHGKLNSTGVGATACAWHGCFYPHSVVDFQKGERQLNMDYSLCNALSYNMNGIQNVICFYDVNCTYMKNLRRQVDNSTFLEIAPSLRIVVGIRMWHVHRHKKECYARYSPLFIRGSGWVDGEIIKTLWSTLNIVSTSTHRMTSPHHQELLDFQMNDSNFMKMIWMTPTVHGVELHLLQTSTTSGMHHGATSWLTRGLVIEEAEVALAISQKAIGPNPSDLKRLVIARRADRVAAEQKSFIADSRIYLQMDTTLDDSEECDRNHEEACQNILLEDDLSSNGGNSDWSAGDIQDTDTLADPTSPTLPLPSNLGVDRCCAIGIHWLAEMELELWIAQANDALHGLCLALADKAVIFRGVVRTTMITLGAKPKLLLQYQELQKSHLMTNTAAFTQGAHDHRASQLPWFWSIDIPRDTSSKSWLTEFSTIHLQKFTESTGSMLKQEKIIGQRRNLC
ncbi:hypothetical protein EDD16DRAFT_1527596 [Pisolithus croceorrhizus]|nr:hypothetical protein EDD16DRAFT_1527596 [Pisolithus croceorrhizus]